LWFSLPIDVKITWKGLKQRNCASELIMISYDGLVLSSHGIIFSHYHFQGHCVSMLLSVGVFSANISPWVVTWQRYFGFFGMRIFVIICCYIFFWLLYLKIWCWFCRYIFYLVAFMGLGLKYIHIILVKYNKSAYSTENIRNITTSVTDVIQVIQD